jgi:hypothetical protein
MIFKKVLLAEIVFDDDFDKIKRTPGRISADDDFHYGKINIKIQILIIYLTMEFVMLKLN